MKDWNWVLGMANHATTAIKIFNSKLIPSKITPKYER